MLTRRTFCLCCAQLPFAVSTSAEEVGMGCDISDGVLESTAIYNSPPKNLSKKLPEIFGSSEDATFDRALGRILAMLASDFSVTPGFGYYDDSDGANARANKLVRIASTRDGTIIFGLNMLQNALNQEGGDIAVAAICAHEFAHIYQYNYGVYEKLVTNLPLFCKELHADFCAGWFLAKLKNRRPNVRLYSAGQFFANNGNKDFFDPDSHGTSRQRVRSSEQGFKYCVRKMDSRIQECSAAGYNYLDEIFG